MNFEEIQTMISFIQFHSTLSKDEKNRRIKNLEKLSERCF